MKRLFLFFGAATIAVFALKKFFDEIDNPVGLTEEDEALARNLSNLSQG